MGPGPVLDKTDLPGFSQEFMIKTIHCPHYFNVAILLICTLTNVLLYVVMVKLVSVTSTFPGNNLLFKKIHKQVCLHYYTIKNLMYNNHLQNTFKVS